jgi:glycosyltransferase involved in cell wall biosynthesis
MNILHLEFGRHVYGGALQAAYLVRGLTAHAGIISHLAIPEGSPLRQHVPDNPRIHLHSLAISGEADLRVPFRLSRLVRETGPDVIHIHSRRGADLWGVLVARRHRIPYILTRRVDNADPRWLARWRTRKAAFVVGISARICEVQRASGVEPAKIRRILSTVDTEAYCPGADRSYLEAQTGIPSGAPAIGMIAQLIERKGHAVLFKAIPEILSAHPQAQFLIFGKGPLFEPLQASIANEPWKNQVRFMGFRDDLTRILPSLDIVTHPAYMEGLGVSLLQASASGVPVVACEAGGIPEVIEDGTNGFLVPPGDHAALARSLSRLLGDRELREEMGKNGRRIAEERFSIGKMAADYVDLYRLAATDCD